MTAGETRPKGIETVAIVGVSSTFRPTRPTPHEEKAGDQAKRHQHNRISSAIASCLTKSGITVHILHPTAISHDHSHSHSPHASNPTFHITPFTPLALTPLLTSLSPDLLLSTLPSTSSPSLPQTLISSCIASRTPRFIPSEFGHDTQASFLSSRLPAIANRAAALEILRSCAQKGELEWVGVATGGLLDRGLVSGELGYDIAWHSASLCGSASSSPGQRFAASSTAHLAAVVLAVVNNWSRPEVRNRYLYAAEVVTTPRAVVGALEAEMGVEWTVGVVGVEDVLAEAERRFERGWPDAGILLRERGVLAAAAEEGVRGFVDADASGVLGVSRGRGQGERLREIVRAAVREFGAKGKGGCGCD